MYTETKLRSFAKALCWRLFGTIVTSVTTFLFTWKLNIALIVGGAEAVSKLLLFYLHERLWDKLAAGKREPKPAVVWFTGLSGAGKSTLANAVYEKLKARGLKVERLDGDTVRDIFPQTGYSAEARDAHIQRVGLLASKLEANGIFVVASFISPYCKSRQFVRNLCCNFFEVYVSTPLEVCENRDVKGLYAKARQGEVKNFTGIDDPYEPPLTPQLTIDTSVVSVSAAAEQILNTIQSKLVSPAAKTFHRFRYAPSLHS